MRLPPLALIIVSSGMSIEGYVSMEAIAEVLQRLTSGVVNITAFEQTIETRAAVFMDAEEARHFHNRTEPAGLAMQVQFAAGVCATLGLAPGPSCRVGLDVVHGAADWVCRGKWARVTIDQFRRLALQTC